MEETKLEIDEKTWKEWSRNLKRFREDTKWLNDKLEEFRLEYPGEFVAVFRKDIVGHHRGIKELCSLLKEDFSEEDVSSMAMKFISSKKVRLIV